MSCLDLIFKNPTIQLTDLYTAHPFNRKSYKPYAGEVIQHLLIELAKVDGSKVRDSFSQNESLQYKKCIFQRIIKFINEETIASFKAKDCSIALHRIAQILSDKTLRVIVEEEKIQLLFLQCYNKRFQANSQDISNTLWALGKMAKVGKISSANINYLNELIEQLYNPENQSNSQVIANSLWGLAALVETQKISNIDTKHLNHLIEQLFNLRKKAKPLHIVNSLWAFVKISEAEKISNANASHLSSLLEEFYNLRNQANPQHIANILWTLAKMIEIESIHHVNVNHLNGIIEQLHTLRDQSNLQDIANSLWAIGKLNSSESNSINFNQLNNFIEAFYNLCQQANPQQIANTLWALGKIVKTETLLNTNYLNSIIKRFYNIRSQANPQEIANSLWGLGKIVEAGAISNLSTNNINGLIEQLCISRSPAKPQHIANSLWTLGKMIEAGQISYVNMNHIGSLMEKLYNLRNQASSQEISNSLWAIGILQVRFPLLMINPVYATLLLKQINVPDLSLAEKHQILMAIELLKIEHSERQLLIEACKHDSTLSKTDIAPYIQHACSYEKEAFISGFFVDLLIFHPNGKKQIIEFDGMHHSQAFNHARDHFRDNLLKSQGYEIVRILNNKKNSFPFYPIQEKTIFAPALNQFRNNSEFIQKVIEPTQNKDANLMSQNHPALLFSPKPTNASSNTPSSGLKAHSPVFIPRNF